MSPKVDSSIIDYARYHGLIRDHLEDDPLEHITHSADILSDLEDDHLPQIHPDIARIPDERLTLDKDAVSLLASIAALAQTPPARNDGISDFDVHRVRRMKLELPMLRTDPELDLLRFAPRIVPDLENEFLPLETVDQEADEGFDWPSWCHSLPDEYIKRIKAEKLEVTSDALAILQEVIQFDPSGTPSSIIEDIELPLARVGST